MNKKFKLIVILPLFVLTFVSCVTVSNIGTDNWRDYFKPGSTKEEIAKDFNLYRGKWWNFYVRGRWYAEGGYYDEAIQDFKKSVSIRSRDQRSARSYGLHFWEYFGHRELGIVYYNQKKYGDAKKELEISLSTADSARAKFYLNKCNEEILKTTQADQEPPQIRISSHADGEIVNTQVVKLNGTAVDDCYVNCVYVQGKKLFTELAKRDLTFSENVSLRAGENAIDIEAVDLLGKNTKRSLKITLDVHPPILCLDEIQIRQKDGKQIATIKGIIVDDYALKDFFINDTEMHIESYKEEKFDKDIALSDNGKVSFKVRDIAGNETKGEYQIDKKASLWPKDTLNGYKLVYNVRNPILVAASKMDGTAVKMLLASQDAGVSQPSSSAGLPQSDEGKNVEGKNQSVPQNAGTDSAPPIVRTDVKSAIVYDTNLFISGDAHDDNGVAKLFVNQNPLEIRAGKHVFFNHLLTLNEGENIVSIKAVDTQGNETQIKPVKITKKTFELLESDARYTVALLPLRTFAEQGIPSETIYSSLLKAFDEEPKRFNFVERDRAKLEEILHEQKINNTELTSPDTAVKIGKIRAAEGMLFGSVEEDAKGINITLRLVDTETTQVLANADVYDEDKSVKNLEWLTHGLSLKMKQQFPMIQGNVIYVSGNGFHVNAGAASGVGIGMKLLLFREIKEGDFVLKEPLDAIARVVQVQPDTCFAKIISSKGAEKVEKKDFVVTK
ncbi:MAG: hypothetical protein A3G70_01830 [Planctomycetes bacterium RIFCSPLOWO2_12_FULL_39_13]|nr:MAG: hypothetical protein A3G70_01830 [Planctomycetes bacterium RIFCSPLOWO2_12_FULL_39_13]